MSISIHEILESQKRQRYQSIIIMKNLLKNSENEIEKLFEGYEYDYFDIISLLKKNEDMAKNIGEISIDEIKEIIKNQQNEKSKIMIIDNMELLISTFSQDEIEAFMFCLEKDEFKKYGTKCIQIFMLPISKEIERYKMVNQDNNISRIIKIYDITIGNRGQKW